MLRYWALKTTNISMQNIGTTFKSAHTACQSSELTPLNLKSQSKVQIMKVVYTYLIKILQLSLWCLNQESKVVMVDKWNENFWSCFNALFTNISNLRALNFFPISHHGLWSLRWKLFTLGEGGIVHFLLTKHTNVNYRKLQWNIFLVAIDLFTGIQQQNKNYTYLMLIIHNPLLFRLPSCSL